MLQVLIWFVLSLIICGVTVLLVASRMDKSGRRKVNFVEGHLVMAAWIAFLGCMGWFLFEGLKYLWPYMMGVK